MYKYTCFHLPLFVQSFSKKLKTKLKKALNLFFAKLRAFFCRIFPSAFSTKIFQNAHIQAELHRRLSDDIKKHLSLVVYVYI